MQSLARYAASVLVLSALLGTANALSPILLTFDNICDLQDYWRISIVTGNNPSSAEWGRWWSRSSMVPSLPADPSQDAGDVAAINADPSALTADVCHKWCDTVSERKCYAFAFEFQQETEGNGNLMTLRACYLSLGTCWNCAYWPSNEMNTFGWRRIQGRKEAWRTLATYWTGPVGPAAGRGLIGWGPTMVPASPPSPPGPPTPAPPTPVPPTPRPPGAALSPILLTFDNICDNQRYWKVGIYNKSNDPKLYWSRGPSVPIEPSIPTDPSQDAADVEAINADPSALTADVCHKWCDKMSECYAFAFEFSDPPRPESAPSSYIKTTARICYLSLGTCWNCAYWPTYDTFFGWRRFKGSSEAGITLATYWTGPVDPATGQGLIGDGPTMVPPTPTPPTPVPRTPAPPTPVPAPPTPAPPTPRPPTPAPPTPVPLTPLPPTPVPPTPVPPTPAPPTPVPPTPRPPTPVPPTAVPPTPAPPTPVPPTPRPPTPAPPTPVPPTPVPPTPAPPTPVPPTPLPRPKTPVPAMPVPPPQPSAAPRPTKSS